MNLVNNSGTYERPMNGQHLVLYCSCLSMQNPKMAFYTCHYCSGLNTSSKFSGYWNNNNWYFFLFQFPSTIQENCAKLFQKHKTEVSPSFKFPLVKFLICLVFQGIDCFEELGTCLPFLLRVIWAYLHFYFCSVNWASF